MPSRSLVGWYFDRRRETIAQALLAGNIAVFPDHEPEKTIGESGPAANLPVGKNLRRQNLSRYTRLAERVLTHCDFRYSRLDGLKLDNADFSSSNLRHASCRRVDASGATFRDVDACWSFWAKSKFRGGSLRNSSFVGSDLRGCDFSGCDLSNAEFMGALIEGGNFEGANLSRANLRYANLSGANFKGAIFEHTDVSFASMTASTMPEILLSRGNYYGVDAFKHSQLEVHKVAPPFWRKPEHWLFDNLKKIPGLTRVAALIY